MQAFTSMVERDLGIRTTDKFRSELRTKKHNLRLMDVQQVSIYYAFVVFLAMEFFDLITF